MISGRKNDKHHVIYVNPTIQLNAGLWTLFAGATIFLALRIWIKIARHNGLWWDDHILLISWVCSCSAQSVNLNQASFLNAFSKATSRTTYSVFDRLFPRSLIARSGQNVTNYFPGNSCCEQQLDHHRVRYWLRHRKFMERSHAHSHQYNFMWHFGWAGPHKDRICSHLAEVDRGMEKMGYLVLYWKHEYLYGREICIPVGKGLREAQLRRLVPS